MKDKQLYYQLRQTPVMDGLYRAREPDLGRGMSWWKGTRHTKPIPEPLEVELNDTFGTKLPDIFDGSILLMSDAMVAALHKAGADNFDAYKAVLVDHNRKKRFSGYKAVQIIGRVSAVDLSASDVFNPLGIKHTAIQFRKLAVDHEKAKTIGLLIFRFA